VAIATAGTWSVAARLHGVTRPVRNFPDFFSLEFSGKNDRQ